MTDEAVMASKHEEGGAPSPPPRTTPCPTCGAVDWYGYKKSHATYWRCRPCASAWMQAYRSTSVVERDGRRQWKPNPKSNARLLLQESNAICSICATPKRGGGLCLVCLENRIAALGERRVRERFPDDYVALLVERLDAEQQRALWLRFGYANRGPAQPPKPSSLFHAISPGLDDRLIREHLNTDPVCLRTLATLRRHEQGAFLDRYRVDAGEALRWATLPDWKRPIMAGDEEDRLIWKIFTILRLKAEWCARFNEQGMTEEGYQLTQLAGALGSLKIPHRLSLVLSLYGGALRDRVEVGDVIHPPFPKERDAR